MTIWESAILTNFGINDMIGGFYVKLCAHSIHVWILNFGFFFHRQISGYFSLEKFSPWKLIHSSFPRNTPTVWPHWLAMGGAKYPFFLLSIPKNHKKVNPICNVQMATRALEVVVWEWNLKFWCNVCRYNGKTTVWLRVFFNVCVNYRYSTFMDIHGQQLFLRGPLTWFV